MCIYPGAVVAPGAASSQTGVEVGDAVRAAHRGVLVDPAATVHVATARQVPVGHRKGRTAERDGRRLHRLTGPFYCRPLVNSVNMSH